MSDQRDGGIAWTDQTWNPLRGCSRVSEGCRNCYAEKVAQRFNGPGQPYEGLANERGWTRIVRTVPEHMGDPIRWKRPRRVFVNSMSDLFHEDVPNEYIAAVFGVMAACPQHTFQVLTKRAERLPRWFEWASALGCHGNTRTETCREIAMKALGVLDERGSPLRSALCGFDTRWPLPNVWLGVSIEDQATADERIPHLLRVPAAVRFVSAEPLLGPVDLSRVVDEVGWRCGNEVFARRLWDCIECGGTGWHEPQGPQTRACRCRAAGHSGVGLDWVIVGGESGPGARPCDVAWVRSVVRQCRDAQVACFVKQLGAQPVVQHPMQVGALFSPHMNNRKGGDPSEWPDDMRVREWPGTKP